MSEITVGANQGSGQKPPALPDIARTVEFIGKGSRVFDRWCSDLDGLDAQQYGSRENIRLIFEAVGIKRGLVVDVGCGERTCIPDMPELRGIAVDFQREFLDSAACDHEARKTKDTPPVKFVRADVAKGLDIPAGSASAVLWNGELRFYLKKYSAETGLGGFEGIRAAIISGRGDELRRLKAQGGRKGAVELTSFYNRVSDEAGEAIVDEALKASWELVGKGGYFISAGEHSAELASRMDRLGLGYSRIVVVGDGGSRLDEARNVKAIALRK